MKGNKRILALAFLVLLLAVCFGTYAIYRQSATGNGSLDAAAWSVEVNGTDISSASFDFDIDDITWTTHTGKNDTIAPGDSGTIEIDVDATGSEVDVLIEAAVDTTTANLPDGFTVTASGTGGVTEIPYSASDMSTTITLTVTWTGTISDSASKDLTDLDAAGDSFTIPVTLTARQKLASD